MLTDAVHEAGSKVAVQLYHAGRQTHRAVTGTEIYAPLRYLVLSDKNSQKK